MLHDEAGQHHRQQDSLFHANQHDHGGGSHGEGKLAAFIAAQSPGNRQSRRAMRNTIAPTACAADTALAWSAAAPARPRLPSPGLGQLAPPARALDHGSLRAAIHNEGPVTRDMALAAATSTRSAFSPGLVDGGAPRRYAAAALWATIITKHEPAMEISATFFQSSIRETQMRQAPAMGFAAAAPWPANPTLKAGHANATTDERAVNSGKNRLRTSTPTTTAARRSATVGRCTCGKLRNTCSTCSMVRREWTLIPSISPNTAIPTQSHSGEETDQHGLREKIGHSYYNRASSRNWRQARPPFRPT